MKNSWIRPLLFFGLAFFIFAACGRSGRSKTEQGGLENYLHQNGKIKVLSTTAMIGDMVQRVGKGRIDHMTLIVGEVDPHSYELVKGDDEKIDFADIVFYNGLGLEHGASLQYRLQHHPRAVPLGDLLQKKMGGRFLYVDGQIDPHIWMDVGFWKETVPLIAEALSDLDPDHKEEFWQNAMELQNCLTSLDQQIYEMLQAVPKERRYLVTSHDAFNYFTRRYLADSGEEDWRCRFAAPEGLAPDGQLSTSHLQEIIDHLKCYRVSVLFPESNVNKDSLRKIQKACAEKGLSVRIAAQDLFGDAMGDVSSGADNYCSMMKKNAETIVAELSNLP